MGSDPIGVCCAVSTVAGLVLTIFFSIWLCSGVPALSVVIPVVALVISCCVFCFLGFRELKDVDHDESASGARGGVADAEMPAPIGAPMPPERSMGRPSGGPPGPPPPMPEEGGRRSIPRQDTAEVRPPPGPPPGAGPPAGSVDRCECGAELRPGDKFCRVCGTARGGWQQAAVAAEHANNLN